MDKLFLVVHIYKTTNPCIYIIKQKNLSEFIGFNSSCEVKVYEWDADKLASAMQEVEVEFITNITKKLQNEQK